MGNIAGNLSNLMFQQVQSSQKTINKQAFNYYRRPGDYIKLEGIFEVETDDFSKTEEIRKKLLDLPDLYVTSKIREDVIIALNNYLNENESDKIILSQTQCFLFKTNANAPFLSIKNTQAEANREKLKSTLCENTKFTGYYVASCDLSKLWTHF